MGGTAASAGAPMTGGTRSNGGSPTAGASGSSSGGSPSSTGGGGAGAGAGAGAALGSGGTTALGGSAGSAAAGAANAGGGGQTQGGAAGSSSSGGSGAGQAGSTNGGGGNGGSSGGGSNIDTKNVTTTCPGAVPKGVTSVWCSCEQWGEKASGSYTYYNDIWGSGPGPQCIWLADSGAWGVTSAHPNTSGIKSYPNISLSPQKAISSINTYTSSFDLIVPKGGAYETAYDLWVKGTTSSRIEIMLWMTYQGKVQPIAKSYDASGAAVPDASNVMVGGHTWNVFYGSNGSNDVASFVRTSSTSSATVDIKAILLWLIANNKSGKAQFTSSYTLDQVQFGHEISSDSGTQAYVTNSFTVTAN